MTANHLVKIEDAKVQYLSVLYRLDGRDKREHSMRGTYTGLVAKYGVLGI